MKISAIAVLTLPQPTDSQKAEDEDIQVSRYFFDGRKNRPAANDMVDIFKNQLTEITPSNYYALKDKDNYYYFLRSKEYCFLFYSDTVFEPEQLKEVFKNIQKAFYNKDEALFHNIVANPGDYLISKEQAIQDTLSETRMIMLGNLEKLLARAEKIEELEDKTQILAQQRHDFKKISIKSTPSTKDKIISTFCCLFSCLDKRDKKDEKNEKTPLIEKRKTLG